MFSVCFHSYLFTQCFIPLFASSSKAILQACWKLWHFRTFSHPLLVSLYMVFMVCFVWVVRFLASSRFGSQCGLFLNAGLVLNKRKFPHDLCIKARQLGNGDCPIVEMPCDLILTACKFFFCRCGFDTL